jgi:arginyl-tRNA synthetase
MKYYLLKVDPKKKMVFNPEESIDFHGFTGPFIQYTYARIKSILRKTGFIHVEIPSQSLLPLEKQLLVKLEQFSKVLTEAADELNPAVLANYIYHLAKLFNSFYSEHSVVNAENEEKKHLRLGIAIMVANVLKSGMELLGIKVPERM